MLDCRSLGYRADGETVFAALRALPWAMWLDSGRPGSGHGRYDIFVAAPRATLISHDGRTRYQEAGRISELGEPLPLLGELLAARGRPVDPRFPFAGGAVGYFGYGLGRRLQGVASRHPEELPELAVGLYDWAVVTDHLARETWWVGRSDAAGAFAEVRALLASNPPPPVPFRARGALRQLPSRDGYDHAFACVQRYLRDGDCYQVNLARALEADYSGDPWDAYRCLRARSPGPYSAYLDLPFAQVLSVSPERFLAVREGLVETRPIKGTRPRRAEAEADRRELAALRGSDKDRAENVMIVDLLRNDLGRVCATGTVSVPELFAVESFATVHHLVSTVRGRLRPDRSLIDLLQAALPGGSITGAPKVRAMEIIDELEPAARSVYCGAIGYLGDDGAMDTNIAIRTAVCAGQRIRYWAGGGIVIDSRCDAEFQETIDKARAFLELVGA